jgi:hypothetical protein
MWWEPRSNDEIRMAEILPRLERRYIAQYSSQFVLGVGSFFSQEGLRPLLLLNQMATEVLPPVPYVINIELLPPTVFEQLRAWELPYDTMFFFVTPPEPVATHFGARMGPGTAIRCKATKTRGTLAVAVAGKPGWLPVRGFLTVGHLAPLGCGSIIELIEVSRFGRTRYRSIGRVVECITPMISSGQPEYDAAIVKLLPLRQLGALPYRGLARIRSPLTQPLLATLHGGVSGVVAPAALVGGLTAYGGPWGIWKNSWIVLPSGLISQGDSGGILVLDETKTVAGMIVGGSRVENSTVYMAQYAHDMEALERDVLQPRGFRLTYHGSDLRRESLWRL